MTPTTHIVKVGDTLWDLSQQYLQDPKRWPEIWNYNNDAFVRLPAANKMRPSVAIKNPHLIFVGQKLLVPTVRGKTQYRTPVDVSKGKHVAVDNVRSVPIKYGVDSREYLQYLPGGFVAKLKISAEVTLQSLKTYSFADMKNNELTIKSAIKKDNESVLNNLLSDFTVGLNTNTKQISFESQVTVNSDQGVAHTYSSKVSVDPVTGLPVYTVSIKFPEIKGKLGKQAYVVAQYQVDIEISKDLDTQRRNPTVVGAPVSIPAKHTGSDWAYAIAAGMIVGAVVIVVATIAEDIITLGVGLWNDATSFTLAAAMLGRAWTMIRVQQLSVTVGAGSITGGVVVSQ